MIKLVFTVVALFPLFAAGRRNRPWRDGFTRNSGCACTEPSFTTDYATPLGTHTAPTNTVSGSVVVAAAADPPLGAQLPSTNPPENTVPTTGTFWTPAAGTTWQIDLPNQGPDFDSSGRPRTDVEAYTVDFENRAAIDKLHANGKKVICYFSVGTTESFRNDLNGLSPSVIGNQMHSWNEDWLDIRSEEVRVIMKKRVQKAAANGCDAIDPDNIDGYESDNDSGLDLTLTDTIDYVKFLANEAHALGMAIGQKNAGKAVTALVNVVQFSVQEECIEQGDCKVFAPFIAAGKPVFNIEYPPDGNEVSEEDAAAICRSKPQGFTTILKNWDLDHWIKPCV